MDAAAFKDPEPPSYTEAQSCPSVQPIIELKPDSEWTSPPLITATAPPMPIAPSMPTTLPMPTVPPLSPAPPMAPGQIPVDLNMLVTPEQLDVLFHVAR
uniref:Uncharacterized protein n=1 Tax=Amphimedon queenslandica TaxID=400682 RepID=A0A1X7VLJ4_AMPQE